MMGAILGTKIGRKYFIYALLLAALCGCDRFITPIHTGEKIMSELTKTMQPVCLGRLVVEIPTVAKIKGWGQKIDDIKIESVSPPSLNQKAFDAKVAQREKQLKTSPHDTDGVLLKNKIQLNPDSVLLVYREDKTSTRTYQLNAMFWRPTTEYEFIIGASNKYLDEITESITKLVKSFTPMSTADLLILPTGLCVEHGVFTGNEFRGEAVSIAGRIDGYPGLGFSLSTQTSSKPPEEPGLIARIDRSFNMGDDLGKEITAATRFIRKGKRKLNGQPGEELVAVMTIDGMTTFEASAEFYAEPNSLEKPIIEISLSDQTHDNNTRKPFNKNLTEKEFLALWDSLLNGIQTRQRNLFR